MTNKLEQKGVKEVAVRSVANRDGGMSWFEDDDDQPELSEDEIERLVNFRVIQFLG